MPTYDYLNDLDFLTALDKLNMRTHYVKIVLLSFDEKPIRSIEGNVLSGSLTVNGSATIRRTISLSMIATPENSDLENLDNEIAIDKKVKIYVGYDNPLKKYADYGSPVWFPCGMFILSSATISRSTSGWSINISGKDKMCQLDGTVGGMLPATTIFHEREIQNNDGSTIIEQPTIFQIIFEAVQQWGNELAENIIITDLDETTSMLVRYMGNAPIYFNQDYTSFSFNGPTTSYPNAYTHGEDVGYQETDFTYPGELILNAGDTVTKLLDKITEVLGNFEYFYDIDGKFHFQEIKNYLNTGSPLDELTIEDYTKSYNNAKFLYSLTDLDTTVSINRNPSYDNIKNDFYAWGSREDVLGNEWPIRYHLAIDSKPEIYYAGKYMWEIRNEEGNLEPYQFTDRLTYKTSTSSTLDENTLVLKRGYPTPQLIGSPCGEWREELYRQALQAQVTTSIAYSYYDNELIAEWRKLYYMDKNKNMVWNSNVFTNPTLLDYWLDFIDEGSEIGKYSINKIGRRTKVINNSKASAVYNKEVPEILFIRSDSNLSNYVQQYRAYGKQVFFLSPQYYNMFSISTSGASCFDSIREMLYQNLSYNTTISLTCLPKYYLEPNNIIHIQDKDSNINGNYQITQFTLPLAYNGTMNITATEVLTRV